MKHTEPIELDMAYKAYNEQGDVELAISLYEIAAKENSIEAMEALIDIYLSKGVIKSGHVWMEKIIQEAESGKPDFQLALSKLHLSKNIPDASNQIAFDFLLKAANNCNADAQYILADLYCSGLHQVERSTERAGYWLRRAYKNRHPAAIYDIACFHLHKNNKKEKAMCLLKKSSDLGFDQATDALNTQDI
ncbi:tetratricopeptide repeat protein [Comamonas sp. JUb58]|uniref:tetratricopeptide repeat protein n=1 Tax=Comamonas sp. JUb58 TaxID=2485114 RepID=UPI00105D65F8|nr:tetratricopeptide repeat protein [Comamonas sp. JUb58]TDS85110.1 Sel1 repeat-containing protein [Comamonas sp. JUb58]